ncbi:MAG: heparinase II/III family protein [Pseudomonadota bacterium]
MALFRHIEQKVRQHASRLTYNSPLYNWSLGGSTPSRLLFSPCDLWKGNADNARWLIHSGSFSIGDDRLELHDANWHPKDVDQIWINHIHGFDWLRDLRALGGHQARRAARLMISDWIDQHDHWHETYWHPAILGRRVGNWFTVYDFFGESADDHFQEKFLDCLVRQLRHLRRSLPSTLYGLDLLYALRALAYGGLTLEGREDYLEAALHYLDEAINKQILSDGGHISRNPEQLLQAVKIMIDIRASLRQGGYPPIPALQQGLDRAIQTLRFLRHTDGAFALFHGAQENTEDEIKTALVQAGMRARPLKSLPHSGYEKVTKGRSVMIIDTGKPAVWPHDEGAHFAPLAFEFSHARQRIFVNCGAHPTSPDWQGALRSTPAHNTLIIDDRNVCDLRADGSLRNRPKVVEVTRDDKNDGTLIDASHDGYVPQNGIIHRRRLYLSEKGFDFRGEETLSCMSGLAKDHNIAIRFHLHPDVKVSLVKEGKEALLRLKNGVGWRFTAENAALSLDNSIYLGQGIRPRKTKQLVMNSTMSEDLHQLKWALQKEGG